MSQAKGGLVVKRTTLAALVALLLTLVTGPAAWSQTTLTGSDPAEGAELTVAPERITLTFSEPVDPDLVVMFVTGADGVAWPVGELTADGDSVTMPVTPSGPAGRCVVRYNIASGTDPVRGAVSFTLTAPAPSAAVTSVAEQDTTATVAGRRTGSGGAILPSWVWVVVSAAVAGLVVGIVLVRRRTPPAGS